MTVSLLKATDICSNCGADCAPVDSIEVDPLCTACKIIDLPAEVTPFDLMLLMHLTAITSPIMPRPDRICRGYGEDCGLPIFAPADLCPDCHMARMNTESPRIPR